MSVHDAARPDSFVALMPITWGLDATAPLLEEVFIETWVQEIDVTLEATADEAEVLGRGAVEMPAGWRAQLIVEPAIGELAYGLAPDFAASELALLEQHEAIVRLTVESAGRGQGAARRCAQLISALVHAGSPAAVIPMTMQIHSPRFVRRETMDLQIPSLVNLFIGAWNSEDWMISRGLTAFGLPEVETPIVSGMNDAYFRLLDVAANLVMMGASFPTDAPLQIGHALFELRDGPQGPEDERVPLAGHFGRLSVMPV